MYNCFTSQAVITMANLAGLKRVKLPLRYQYSIIGANQSTIDLLKNVLRPVYRNYFPNTYHFFTPV